VLGQPGMVVYQHSGNPTPEDVDFVESQQWPLPEGVVLQNPATATAIHNGEHSSLPALFDIALRTAEADTAEVPVERSSHAASPHRASETQQPAARLCSSTGSRCIWSASVPP
jgi:hypothetical protein